MARVGLAAIVIVGQVKEKAAAAALNARIGNGGAGCPGMQRTFTLCLSGRQKNEQWQASTGSVGGCVEHVQLLHCSIEHQRLR